MKEIIAEGNTIIAEFIDKIKAFENKYGGIPNVYIDVITPIKSKVYPYQDWVDKNKHAFSFKEIDLKVWYIDRTTPIKVLKPE